MNSIIDQRNELVYVGNSPTGQKGIFLLDYKKVSIPTNTSMYYCKDCHEIGVNHFIFDAPGPPSRYGGFSRIGVCSNCGRYDGPWIPAY